MKPTIIFFGTHDFAAVILENLLASDVGMVKAIITQPDKPVGRNQKLEAPAVKKKAEHLNFKGEILQPATLKDKTVQQKLSTFGADIFIVVEYGKLIPQGILDLPPRGTINVHPSILPAYRGPSPIQQALVDGAQKTGTTIMLLDADMDHGPVLAQKEVSIKKEDSLLTLRATLALESANLLVKTLPQYLSGAVKPQEQDHSKTTFTKLFEREDGRIDWTQPADTIYNLFRGLTPWPGVFTEITKDGKPLRLKILAMSPTSTPSAQHKPGSFITEKNRLLVATGTTLIEIEELQLEGKKPLNSAEFVRGFSKHLTQ